jgi:hypothetical protein
MRNYNPREMWFEVDGGWRGWFKAPISGADSSPQNWGADGTLLNGLGYAVQSWGSHRLYQYEWGASSTRQEAQFIQALANGTYGRGLVHFIEPTLYDQNILPARVADPSMAVDDEGASLVDGIDPEGVFTSNWETNLLPITSAYYNLLPAAAGYRGDTEATYIPIPEGYTLYLGAFYSAMGSGGIFAREVLDNGVDGDDIPLTALGNDSAVVTADTFSGIRGVRLWLGKTASGAASVTVAGMIARLVRNSVLDGGPESGYGEGGYGEEVYGGSFVPGWLTAGPWVPGGGNAGCRFIGKPTFETNTGVRGGQVGFSATLREVGYIQAA